MYIPLISPLLFFISKPFHNGETPFGPSLFKVGIPCCAALSEGNVSVVALVRMQPPLCKRHSGQGSVRIHHTLYGGGVRCSIWWRDWRFRPGRPEMEISLRQAK